MRGSLKPDAILVMDSLRPHHATEVQDLLDRAGIGLLHLPRYSPEFNPIEQACQDERAAQAQSAPQPGGARGRAQTGSRVHHSLEHRADPAGRASEKRIRFSLTRPFGSAPNDALIQRESIGWIPKVQVHFSRPML